MYERFTDRARKAMQMANQAAQKYNHEYVAPEHMLVGVLKAGGIAAFNVDNAAEILAAIEKHLASVAGPDMVTMGKLPQTPRAKKVIEIAIKEATDLNHNYVGTEHMLLGLMQVGGIDAIQLVKPTVDDMRKAISAYVSNAWADYAKNNNESIAAVVHTLRSARDAIEMCLRVLGASDTAAVEWHTTVTVEAVKKKDA
jgi:ATP-dependent Clp protease ATP-binding subunit ClpA